ncbi:MAG: ATP-binding protein [candidate division WOR-3 bacterium]|nr:ATP-binding protein [candidate division WOR-3 bacterium]
MSLSERTKKLLLGGEGMEVEYKTKVDQSFNEVLVEFANGKGGIVLFGVEDAKDETGRHIGKVIGIEISDQTRGKIQSRADGTYEPIEIIIDDETDEDGKGVYIVTIKEGENKPYCTGGGRYKVRRDGQKCTITPKMMEKFIAPRLQKTPSAKKQLMLEEMRELKAALQQGLNASRDNYPPYYQQEASGMYRNDTIDNIVANLTVDDKELIKLCQEFVDTSKAFAEKWFQAVKTVSKDDFYDTPFKEIEQEFLSSGGEDYKLRLEELYKKIAQRVHAVLS